ncbi:type II secretion system F family protein [Neglectibacter timonensis]|uniref:type II secretion system F family protein n=1 Tax=Neglectibacter timonensis TaxID=1776382 RepID=UPI00266C6711|nr:type II secretion system F family protein [Neglectibacter timonensis]
MPNYKYTAAGSNGKKVRGVMTAPDETALYQRLREEGKYLTASKEVTGKRTSGKLKIVVVADFCRQLGTLLGAGVSLVRALSIIAAEESVKPKVRTIYEEMLRLIRQGVPLSEAMERQAPAFPELLVGMLRSAEVSGNLDHTAKRMAVHYEKEHRINSKVRSAMVYPIILAVMMVAIVVFVVGYILPQFSDLFATMGELPWMTRVVMSFSDLVTNYWYLLILGLAVLVMLIRMVLKAPAVRLAFDKRKLKLPVVGKLLRTIYTARFARTLSSLYGSGVPIMSSLSTAADTVGNQYIVSQFGESVRLLQQGGSLTDALRRIDGFENKLASSIAIGEETGNLDEMLDVTADSYDYASEQAMNRLVTLLEPCMLILMGFMVGFIMLAILLPIFGSYNAIEQSATYY